MHKHLWKISAFLCFSLRCTLFSWENVSTNVSYTSVQLIGCLQKVELCNELYVHFKLVEFTQTTILGIPKIQLGVAEDDYLIAGILTQESVNSEYVGFLSWLWVLFGFGLLLFSVCVLFFSTIISALQQNPSFSASCKNRQHVNQFMIICALNLTVTVVDCF